MRKIKSLLALLALFGALLAPRAAQAAFSATLAGRAITLNGDGAADFLSLSVDSGGPNDGKLRHNRFSLGDAGFESNYDFDSSVAGIQMVTVGPGVTLTINAGGGGDNITINSFAGHSGVAMTIDAGDGADSIRVLAPASTPAQIQVAGGPGVDELVYDDSGDTAAQTIVVTSSQVSMSQGASVDYTAAERLSVISGPAQDTVDVHSTAAGTALSILNPLATSSSFKEDVNIGEAGSTQAILGVVNVSNSAAFSNLNIDDSADLGARTIGVADGLISGIAPATIAYSTTNQISRVSVRGGKGGNRFNVTSASTSVVKWLASGSGDDTFVFVPGATVTGSGQLDCGLGSDTLDYSAFTSAVQVSAGAATGVGTLANCENAIGGSAGDQLFGRSGANSTLVGGPGNDTLRGGDGNDTLRGGPGIDTIAGGAGDDLVIWDDGDGADQIDGGDGAGDRVLATGAPADGDRFAVGLGGTGLVVTRSSPISVTLAVNAAEYLEIDGSGGDDTITATAGLSTTTAFVFHGGDGADILGGSRRADTLDGGAGADTLSGAEGDDALSGGAGADILIGGEGRDTLDGGAESDTLQGGAGDDTLGGGDGGDTIAWADGDGSDTIEGGAGDDTVQVAGAAIRGDTVAIAPDGARFTVERTAPTTDTLDIGAVEHVALATGGGDDTIAIVPLATTTIAVDGGPHSAGDTLSFDRQGLPATPPAPQPPAGTISVPGRQPVSYAQIEKLLIASSAPPRFDLFLPIVRR
jgi:Ca2+-binding RTX toxin-like protein